MHDKIMRSRQPGINLKPTSIYIPKNLLDQIITIAKRERRSLSSEVVILLEQALAKPGKQ